MKSIAPNTLLQNRYLVVHLIGKGGMGDVYLAVDQRLGSAVALKRTFFSDDEMFGTAFEREAKTLARLRHPVLPKVSDHFSENDVQFLVMEHIAGDDLAKRLETAQKPFPLSWVLFWADQLLDALAYLHSNEPQIIHRDIKPQNLKLTDENSIILLDFGLSKNTETDTKAVLSGSTGSVVGYTPHYAPMEQIRGTGTNPRSDIYSLSATLYQLLTNVVPYDSLTRADALLNGMDDPVKPISEINPEVPLAVSTVILKGMQLSQDKRFQNAREMQKTLREAFVQIQNSMTAQTVAFNIQNELTEQRNNPPSSATLNITNAAPAEVQSSSASENFNSATAANHDATAEQDFVEEQNFVETLRMEPNEEDVLPKQPGVKTEIFSQNSVPLVPAAKTKSFSLDENLSSEKNVNISQNSVPKEKKEKKEKTEKSRAKNDKEIYAPNAAPTISPNSKTDYDSSANGDSVFTSPRIKPETDEFATYTPARKNFPKPADQDKQYNSHPPAQEKSSDKTFSVGGALALLALILGAASAGWFVYNNYYAVKKAEIPVSSPAPSVQLPATPTPTVEAVSETNTQSIQNPQIVSSDINNQTNLESRNAASGNSKTSPPQTPPASKPAPQTAVKNKSKTNPAPETSKPASKPADKKPAAPIILQ